ncbi:MULTISPECIES: molybdopterin converting factor subunit 1 [Pseudomonas]|uniref:Molybdopterin synthase sulfur carrier subunit n=2 Tax=Pseudomonas TaxID=286 RepID=A0A2C9EPV0_PSEPH|nr:molybdopterin converting factor subunit 1 [Pseudomonas protegens]GED77739.1 molybdopterin synthase sulfur carrier subunit [Pseudomonas fluorescens]AGL85538.1 molybdopterin converting factor, subunit 1 [Pseudomonas protegens CHA0]AQT10700.1 molybdopterin converting factor subunit 1 [Pseudomonas protegens]MBP5113836.1 molybdopterin converting factor subunit 1 [Pseudomonas protegens]MBP5126339.1 molybdopterin converting factor subunit 1 [Pseudomonas protegens]
MILVNYFARYREQLGCGGEKLSLDASLRTVEDLRQRLMARGETWAQVLGENSLMCALNQELCKLDAAIEDFDEIAFFPQVTGG